jgi:hypothetical protein
MARHHRSFLLLAPILVILLAVSGSSQLAPLHAQQADTSQSPRSQESVGQATPSTTAKAPDNTQKAAPGGEGIPAVVVDGGQVLGVVGKQVRSSAGEDMGRIVDVIIDRSARVRAAVIDFGGFLGVGNRQIAVAWSAIRLPAQDKPGALVVDFTRDQLRVAPAYKAGEQVVLLGQADAQGTSPVTNGVNDKEAQPKEPPSK